jgi:hypothetical protein
MEQFKSTYNETKIIKNDLRDKWISKLLKTLKLSITETSKIQKTLIQNIKDKMIESNFEEVTENPVLIQISGQWYLINNFNNKRLEYGFIDNGLFSLKDIYDYDNIDIKKYNETIDELISNINVNNKDEILILSSRRDLTINHIKKYKITNIKYKYFCQYGNISLNDIANNLDYQWNKNIKQNTHLNVIHLENISKLVNITNLKEGYLFDEPFVYKTEFNTLYCKSSDAIFNPSNDIFKYKYDYDNEKNVFDKLICNQCNTFIDINRCFKSEDNFYCDSCYCINNSTTDTKIISEFNDNKCVLKKYNKCRLCFNFNIIYNSYSINKLNLFSNFNILYGNNLINKRCICSLCFNENNKTELEEYNNYRDKMNKLTVAEINDKIISPKLLSTYNCLSSINKCKKEEKIFRLFKYILDDEIPEKIYKPRKQIRKKQPFNPVEHNILVFDTETTGLIPSDGFCNITPDNTGNYEHTRMVSISYKIVNLVKKEMLPMKKFIIKPEEFNIDDYKTAQEIHKITHKYAMSSGKNIKCVLNQLIKDINDYNVNTICAHNVKFDAYIVASELYRYQNSSCVNNKDYINMFNKFFIKRIDDTDTFNYICTANILSRSIKKKRAILSDYANYFLGIENNDNYHDSTYDTEICMKLLFYIIDNKFDNIKRRLHK